MILNWLASKSVREACTMCKHVKKLLDHQRDLLTPKAVEELEAAIREVREAVSGKVDNEVVATKIKKLEETADNRIKPYPHASYRENVEVFLVALVVAMGIRTFFLQPF